MASRVYWVIKVLSVWHVFLLRWSTCIDCPSPCLCTEDSRLNEMITNCSGIGINQLDLHSTFTNLPAKTTNLYLYHMAVGVTSDTVQINSPALKVLYVNSGHLVSIAEGLKFLSPAVKSRLTVLKLSGNRISTIFPEAFHNFTKLQTLYLANNHVKKIYSGAFTDLSLMKLDLSNNHIGQIYSSAFVGLTSLTELDLSNNPIGDQLRRNPKLLNGLHNLTKLLLKNCSLRSVHERSFAELRSLEYLHLEHNDLNTLPVKALSLIPRLSGLFASYNKITRLLADTSSLRQLTILELSQNKISEVHPGSFGGMDYLKALYIDGNRLSRLHSGLQVSFNYLELLNIHQNPWICDCKLLWLGQWIRDTKTTVFNPECHWPTPIPLKRIHLDDMRCPKEQASLNVQCLRHMWSIPDCPLCPERTRMVRPESDCMCQEGYSSEASGSCSACPKGSYKSYVGNGSCTLCPEGSTTLFPGSATCFCETGWTFRAGKCRECPRNTYKSHQGNHSCRSCPKFAVSSERSTSLDQCLCEHGDTQGDFRVGAGTCKPPYSGLRVTAHIRKEASQVHIVQDSWLPRVYIPMGIASLLSASCIIVVVAVCCKRRRSRYSQLLLSSTNKGIKLMHGSSDECKFTDGKYFVFEGRYADLSHIKVKRLKIGRLLGKGAFGNVHEGFAYGSGISDSHPLTVAVKRLKDSASDEERQAFKTELEQMRLLGNHTNIIGLVGSCNLNGQMAIIMEYATLGNLLSYLKEKSAKLENYVSISPDGAIAEEKARQITEETELMLFAWQIARGMAHLESLKCVHRDLASRNILIAAGPIAKISDFGLTRDVYENGYYFRSSKGRLPFKWLSPEALLWGQYSTKSDVWSFGILLWEIATLGGSPYPGVPADHLAELHRTSYRMPQPPNCPDKLYGIISACWNEDPRQRPPFHRLADILDQLLLGVAEREYLALENGPKGTLSSLDREINGTDQKNITNSLVRSNDSVKLPPDRTHSTDMSDTSTSGYSSSHNGSFYS